MCHPFAQGGDGYFAPDDDECGEDVGALQVYEDEDAGADEEFVGYGVEEGAKGRCHVEFARQVAVEPVGGGCEGEYRTGGDVAPFIRQIEQQYENRDKQDA